MNGEIAMIYQVGEQLITKPGITAYVHYQVPPERPNDDGKRMRSFTMELPARLTVTGLWHDYETGWHYVTMPEGQRLCFSQFDVFPPCAECFSGLRGLYPHNHPEL